MKTFYTSYFSKYRGDLGVAISNSVPRGFKGLHLKEFAPSWELVREYKAGYVPEKEFACQYLAGLDIVALAYYVDTLPENTVFLCWEKSESFCHRHLFSLALQYAKLASVEELGMSKTYIFAGTEAERARIFNEWAAFSMDFSQSKVISPELKREMCYHSGIIRGIFQNLQPLTKEQYNELITAALFFYDLNNPAFEPLMEASRQLVFTIRNHIRKES